ncbi:helix-turn-helix domain-containing protein [Gloeothece verrucosa]|uniref:Cytoskeleton protein RodZ-like C-terminal domain-containing protein n=1 Tax=Gloeothece verrucosa (strain PCC 7822) TaxID=497965 RepID=E0UBJ4_GLOV7|nr:helix-turn-helix domain-containing protein [Gloeothece verrucosa]ADN12826.1 conserved hypothetical protein [Gloeothece verrucosa PCC 7822]
MNKLNSSQAKQLREVAAYLKQKRIEQSLSLEQIASRTFIRLHILEALEAAQIEQLPELIYIQGFIRRYGEVLRIDGNSLAKRLTQTDNAVAFETPSAPSAVKAPPQPEPVVKAPPQPKPVVKAPPQPEPVIKAPPQAQRVVKTQAQRVIKAQPQAEPVLKAQPQAEPVLKAQPQAEPVLKAQPQAEPVLKTQPQAEREPQSPLLQLEPSIKPTLQRYGVLIAIIACIGTSIALLYGLSRSREPYTVGKSVSPNPSTQPHHTTPPASSTVTKPTPASRERVPDPSRVVTTSPPPVKTYPEKTMIQSSPLAVSPSPQKSSTPPSPVAASPSPQKSSTPPSPVAVSPSPQKSSTPPSPVAASPSPQKSATPPSPVAASPSPQKSATSPSPVASPASSAKKPSNAPLSVALALDGTSWLKVLVDGKTQYEGTLEAGVKQNWTAQEKVTIIAGNAGAVTYSVNSKPAQRLGEAGEVKEIKLTPVDNLKPTPTP